MKQHGYAPRFTSFGYSIANDGTYCKAIRTRLPWEAACQLRVY